MTDQRQPCPECGTPLIGVPKYCPKPSCMFGWLDKKAGLELTKRLLARLRQDSEERA